MKYTQEERQTWVKKWKSSHLSKADFCRAHSLNVKRFYSWFNHQHKLPTTFSKVIVDAKTPRHSMVSDWIESVVLHCQNELRLEFNQGISRSALIELMSALSSCK